MDQHIFWITSISFLFRLVGSISNCTNVLINNHEGIITSPNYPNKYPDYTSCSWFISIPKNYVLSISILDLNIEVDDAQNCSEMRDEYPQCCLRNWLSVPESSSLTRSSRLICGNQPVQSFELPDTLKIASVKFHTSKNIKGGHGFKLKYAIVLKRAVICSNNQFMCSDGQRCIELSQQCDSSKDCDDQSDEINCSDHCLAKGLSSCPHTPSICYNASASACAKQSSCPETMDDDWIPCRDGISCFQRKQFCDNNIDCDDQSDEANCRTATQPSRDADVFFMCDNFQWVRSNKVCDGNDDCGDHSDEDGCVRPSLETAVILGCLSCSLLFILLASYIFHAHHHHRVREHHTSSVPQIRPLLNINSQPYIMPFREPPPPYPLDPPVNRRRYRRHRRHSRVTGSPAPAPPPISVPIDERTESPPQEQAAACTWKSTEEQQDGATSTD